MRILYLSQYFAPEVGATQNRAYEMASNWIRLGHSVTMVTEFPNHPSGIIPGEYKGKIFDRSVLDGIDVVRVWVKASPNKNFLNRMLFYITYMMNAIIAGTFLIRGRFDFLYASSPPLFVGGAAMVLSYLKHIPMIFEVRDLWPQSAIELGELTNPRAVLWATKLEEACYRKAVKIVVVTQGIYDYLIRRNIPVEKLIIIPNGANTSFFTYTSGERTKIRKELHLEGKFIAVYAGIFGLAQGLETILFSAKYLSDTPEIHFLLIGDGPKKGEITSLVKKNNLVNVTLLPERPVDSIPGYLSAADIAIIPLKKAQIFTGVIPSKIFDSWACERPVLISIDGEARQLVEGVRGGRFVPPEDPEIMAETLKELMNFPLELESMGKNGREYTVRNRNRKELAEKLICELDITLHR